MRSVAGAYFSTQPQVTSNGGYTDLTPPCSSRYSLEMSESVDYTVPRLQEYCCKVILNNIESVPSTGDIPFRVIRPVLERCKAEKLEQLELAAPHLVNDTQVIWRKRCLDEFLELRQANENGNMLEPESWREQYFEALAERERKITDSASRLRGMYQKEEAGKRGRQTMYTTKAPPPKRGRWGQIGISKPRTLIDKARQDTRRIQHVHIRNAGSSDQPIVQRKVVPLGNPVLFRPRPTQSTTLPKPPVASGAKRGNLGPSA
ncbi:Elongin-A OS=Schizosaccharomyces pombe (strain 972 / ATCC 24843) GN=pof4 PE=1 SV=3 [Rhizoctonia solani AG-1 IB]|uniref:Elongin-A n=1 Tax=Thanatephorus cucumeris (strain AG1-IB / isolate 7/3/14) TaxID=1108050 RepID=A0A0B7F621_THACB|nr:Elongin-A OS=Schizosaccharomyces pombe (strain 972 / ATCC 24843) GN=pof4 PE=1 SV=3 [Rhizoctonia solani AG-1 IB]